MVLPCYWAWLSDVVKPPPTKSWGQIKTNLDFNANVGYLHNIYTPLTSFKLILVNCFQRNELGWEILPHSAEIHLISCITTPFYEFSAWLNNTFFSLDFMICWLVWHEALARMSSLYKCWQQWSRDVPDGTAHMQSALWPGRLMNPFGS